MTGRVESDPSAGLADEPPDVFCSLASLIVEGRVPRPGNARGYGEGPHVPPQPGSPAALVRHKCSVKEYVCKKDENFRKHMLLLWQNNVPVSIEVLLCSDCRVGRLKANSVEYATIPEPGSILVEQWTVSVCNHRPPPAAKYISSRGLFQAVRSYLHFSQLSAWYSKSGGTEPSNVLFRITIPGEAFSSKFASVPEEHYFPQAVVGRTSSVHVSVRSLPRTGKIPAVVCRHNNRQPLLEQAAAASPPPPQQQTTEASSADRFQKVSRLQQQTDQGKLSSSSSNSSDVSLPGSLQGCGSGGEEEGKLAVAGALPWKETDDRAAINLRKALARNRMIECAGGGGPPSDDCKPLSDIPRSDSMDSMLGDSLLDPPQSLQKFPPKKYQSPSRCGSPSLEAPDHLLFGHFNDTRRFKASEQADLLRSGQDRFRRGLNLFHGLHPRVFPLCSGDQPPRLSLPLKGVEPTTRSHLEPCRAFPPERSCKAAVGRPAHEGGDVSNCTISGKHICHSNDAVPDDHHIARMSRWDRHSTQQQHQQKQQPPDKPASEEERHLGAKRKPRRRQQQTTFKPDDDSDDGGIEVAEYVNVPEVGLYPFADESRQSCLAQKGLEELLDELALNKSACSSRRSSVKDEDCLFPHKCSKKVGGKKSGGKKILDDLMEPVLPVIPPQPVVTQVYRAETELPSPKIAVLRKVDQFAAKKRSRDESEDSERDADNEEDDDEVCSVLSDEEEEEAAAPVPSSKAAAAVQLKGDIAGTNRLHADRGPPSQKASSRSLFEGLGLAPSRKEAAAMLLLEPLDMSFDGSSTPGAGSRGSNDEWTCDDDCASPDDDWDCGGSVKQRENGSAIPTTVQMDSFRKTFNSATSMVFHRTTGFPLSSSPAPMRKGKRDFGYDASINRPTDIKRALFQSQSTHQKDSKDWKGDSDAQDVAAGKRARRPSKKILSASAPATIASTNLLGSFEESVLNGRLEPVSTVEGFTAEIGASGSFHPKHKTVPVTVFFYTLCDSSNVLSPYLGHINLGKKGYRVPPKGTIQVTLFNPLGTVVKMFVAMYDLSDMPPNSQTFLRQRTLYMPTDVGNADPEHSTQKWLRYLVHLRFASSKSGKIYLHTDVRMIIFRKSDLDTATDHTPGKGFELRSFTKGPSNPKFSPRR